MDETQAEDSETILNCFSKIFLFKITSTLFFSYCFFIINESAKL